MKGWCRRFRVGHQTKTQARVGCGMISCGDHGRVSPYPVAQINCDARRVRHRRADQRCACSSRCTGIRAHPWPRPSATRCWTRCLSTGCALLSSKLCARLTVFCGCVLQRHAQLEKTARQTAVIAAAYRSSALHVDRMTTHAGAATRTAASLNMHCCKRSLTLCAPLYAAPPYITLDPYLLSVSDSV